MSMNLFPPALPARTTTPMQPSPAMLATDRRRLSSEDLLGRSQEIEIAHGSEVYRLRRTSLGKLILTK